LFICEGLFSYLSDQVSLTVLQILSKRAAPGSVLAATFLVEPEGGVLARALTGTVDAVLSAIGEPRASRYRPGIPEQLLEDTGWEVTGSATSKPNRMNAGSHLLVVSAEFLEPS
jgi:O-methyltransferase involved in polyketide biosynthesis